MNDRVFMCEFGNRPVGRLLLISNRSFWLFCMHRWGWARRWSWPRGRRIILNCDRSGRQTVVRTFHSPCAWMLRCEAKQTGMRCLVVSTGLANAEVPHLTVEQYEFFRRQEVKDAIA